MLATHSVFCRDKHKMGARVFVWMLSLYGLFGPTKAITAFSNAQTEEFVNAHNTLRRWESGVSNMNIMKWNDELADMAQDYVDMCTGNHGQVHRADPPFSPIGQNIFATQAPYIDNITAVVESWYSEKQWYSYSSNECFPPADKSCGHYTQVIWGDTTDIGCGFKYCENHLFPLQVYCNYGPAGNWKGVWPYSTGGACTECNTGSGWCNNGLCDDSCTATSGSCTCSKICQNCGDVKPDTCTCDCKSGYFGDSCEAECVDMHYYCGGNPGWPVSWCFQYSYVLDYCPAMCGTCTPSTADPCA